MTDFHQHLRELNVMFNRAYVEREIEALRRYGRVLRAFKHDPRARELRSYYARVIMSDRRILRAEPKEVQP